MHKGRPRKRLAIIDRKRLSAIIRDVKARRFEGTMTKAAVAMGVERTLLHRLASGLAATIGFEELSALRRALSDEEFFEVERALLPPRVAELVAANDEWVREEYSRMMVREKPPETIVGRALQSVPSIEFQRAEEMEYLLQTLRRRFPEPFSRFDAFLTRRQHFAPRAKLAYCRIVAPLLDGVDSGHIERRWQEMKDKELLRFLEAGIERERILLDRQPDFQRAQEIAKRDPVELFALYGQYWDTRAFLGRPPNRLIVRWIIARRQELRSGGSRGAAVADDE